MWQIIEYYNVSCVTISAVQKIQSGATVLKAGLAHVQMPAWRVCSWQCTHLWNSQAVVHVRLVPVYCARTHVSVLLLLSSFGREPSTANRRIPANASAEKLANSNSSARDIDLFSHCLSYFYNGVRVLVYTRKRTPRLLCVFLVPKGSSLALMSS